MVITHITNNFKSIYFSKSTFLFVLGSFKNISQDYANTLYAEFTFEENKRNVCNRDKETSREREKTMTRRFHSWSTSWLSFQWNDSFLREALPFLYLLSLYRVSSKIQISRFVLEEIFFYLFYRKIIKLYLII